MSPSKKSLGRWLLTLLVLSSLLGGVVIGRGIVVGQRYPMTYGAKFILYNCSGEGWSNRVPESPGAEYVNGVRVEYVGALHFNKSNLYATYTCSYKLLLNKTSYVLRGGVRPWLMSPTVWPNLSRIRWDNYLVEEEGVRIRVWIPHAYPDARIFAKTFIEGLGERKAYIPNTCSGCFNNTLEYLRFLLETVYKGYATGYQLIIIPLSPRVGVDNDYYGLLTLNPVPPSYPVPVVVLRPNYFVKELVERIPEDRRGGGWSILLESSTLSLVFPLTDQFTGDMFQGLGDVDWKGLDYTYTIAFKSWRWYYHGMNPDLSILEKPELTDKLMPQGFSFQIIVDVYWDPKPIRLYYSWLVVPLNFSSEKIPVLLRNTFKYPWVLARFFTKKGSSDYGVTVNFKKGGEEFHILNIAVTPGNPVVIGGEATVLGVREKIKLVVDFDFGGGNLDYGIPFVKMGVPLGTPLFIDRWVIPERSWEEIVGEYVGCNPVVTSDASFSEKGFGMKLPVNGSGKIVLFNYRVFERGEVVPPGFEVYVNGSERVVARFGPLLVAYFDSARLWRGDWNNSVLIVDYYVFNKTCLELHLNNSSCPLPPATCLVRNPDPAPHPLRLEAPVNNSSSKLVWEWVRIVEEHRNETAKAKPWSTATLPLPTTINGTKTTINTTVSLETVDYGKLAPLVSVALVVVLAAVVLAGNRKKKSREEQERRQLIIDEDEL